MRALLSATAEGDNADDADNVDESAIDCAISSTGDAADAAMVDSAAAVPSAGLQAPPASPLPWGARQVRRAGPHMRGVLRFSRMIQRPEWMTTVPSDLSAGSAGGDEGWLAVPRPEGRHCLVVASNGITVARDSHGFLLARFQSDLPGGSTTALPSDRRLATVLDCVWAEAARCFFALDILLWRGAPAVENPCDFRQFWLQVRTTMAAEWGRSLLSPYLPLPTHPSSPSWPKRESQRCTGCHPEWPAPLRCSCLPPH